MKRYIALLRGVNISGKNKVPMAELKQGFEALDYAAVKTWLNSGNVAFSSEETDAGGMAGRIGGMLRERFGVETKEAGTNAKNVGVEETDPRRPHFVVTGKSNETGAGD